LQSSKRREGKPRAEYFNTRWGASGAVRMFCGGEIRERERKGRRKVEGGRWKEEGARRKEEGGRRKEGGGRRKDEGGRRGRREKERRGGRRKHQDNRWEGEGTEGDRRNTYGLHKITPIVNGPNHSRNGGYVRSIVRATNAIEIGGDQMFLDRSINRNHDLHVPVRFFGADRNRIGRSYYARGLRNVFPNLLVNFTEFSLRLREIPRH
jgi:ATP-dependent RNA helicase DHX57